MRLAILGLVLTVPLSEVRAQRPAAEQGEAAHELAVRAARGAGPATFVIVGSGLQVHVAADRIQRRSGDSLVVTAPARLTVGPGAGTATLLAAESGPEVEVEFRRVNRRGGGALQLRASGRRIELARRSPAAELEVSADKLSMGPGSGR